MNPPWVWNADLTGGFLYETPVHMFDLMTFFFGKVEWVQVAARAHEHDELDDFSILLNFQTGLQATMKTYAHASWHFPFERFEVYGRHSTYETFEMERISFTDGLETKTTTFDFSLASMHEKWGYIEVSPGRHVELLSDDSTVRTDYFTRSQIETLIAKAEEDRRDVTASADDVRNPGPRAGKAGPRPDREHALVHRGPAWRGPGRRRRRVPAEHGDCGPEKHGCAS